MRGLFDTSIAAAFVGSDKLGLAAVLNEYLDVEVNKDKKLQRADWSRRPLTDEMLRYAAQDVLHLGRLKATLDGKLARLGRTTLGARRDRSTSPRPPCSAGRRSGASCR